jgi:hypothetical protein
MDDIIEEAIENLQDIGMDIERPRRIKTEENDQQLQSTKSYKPTRDTLIVETSVTGREDTRKSIESLLTSKYVTDNIVGDIGLEEVESLEQQVDTYREIQDHGFLKPEQNEKEWGLPKFDTIDNPEDDIGKNEQLMRRLAVMSQFEEEFQEKSEELKQRYSEVEEEIEELMEEQMEKQLEIDEHIEDTVDEEAYEEIIHKKIQKMEFERETGQWELEFTRSLYNPDEEIGSSLGLQVLPEKSKVENALAEHGYTDEETVEEVYSLLQKKQEIENENDAEIDELYDKKNELHDQLIEYIDQMAEENHTEIDLYLESIRQRKWKLEESPLHEITAAVRSIYQGYLNDEIDQENYRETVEERIQGLGDTADETLGYFDEMFQTYKETEGRQKEKLRSAFAEVEHFT